jgi:hypothetical protein
MDEEKFIEWCDEHGFHLAEAMCRSAYEQGWIDAMEVIKTKIKESVDG